MYIATGICSAVHSARRALAPFPLVNVHCVVRGAVRKINLQLETNWPISFQSKFIFGIRHGSASAHRLRSGTVPGPCAFAPQWGAAEANAVTARYVGASFVVRAFGRRPGSPARNLQLCTCFPSVMAIPCAAADASTPALAHTTTHAHAQTRPGQTRPDKDRQDRTRPDQRQALETQWCNTRNSQASSPSLLLAAPGRVP